MGTANVAAEFVFPPALGAQWLELVQSDGHHVSPLSPTDTGMLLVATYMPLCDSDEGVEDLQHHFDVWFVSVPGSPRHLLLWIVKQFDNRYKEPIEEGETVHLLSYGLDRPDLSATVEERRAFESVAALFTRHGARRMR